MNIHQPVLLEAAIQGLNILHDGIYIDATFGRGGHAQAILQRLGPDGRLFALDKDWEAVAYGHENFAEDPRFQMVHGSFRQLAECCVRWDVVGRVSGILLDLGVSSPQLDRPERGFSFNQVGPLDMRMDRQQTLTAESFINEASEQQLADVFFEYGEERFSKRIARAIVNARKIEQIDTTLKLAEIVKTAHPKWEKHKHPATRVFQAIRIYVNQELNDLKDCLTQCHDVLAMGGRLVVISFHSLEDRIVKQFLQQSDQSRLPKGIPIRGVLAQSPFKRIGKAARPEQEEIQKNTRARSAILRIGEKQS